jgi:hypothetical protein
MSRLDRFVWDRARWLRPYWWLRKWGWCLQCEKVTAMYYDGMGWWC